VQSDPFGLQPLTGIDARCKKEDWCEVVRYAHFEAIKMQEPDARYKRFVTYRVFARNVVTKQSREQ